MSGTAFLSPSAEAPRSVTILGVTGSIGRSTADLIRQAPERYRVVAVTAESRVAELAAAARALHAERAVIGDTARLVELRERLAGSGIEVDAGRDALIEAASTPVDWTMVGIVGAAALAPAVAAIRNGRLIALANKECLVCAGTLLMEAARAAGATLLPVDSEHNAIFQALAGQAPSGVDRLILTASGGPFRALDRDAMRNVTAAEAVRHPNWSMGAKISVDSATMMNKGLEIIEAHHLFGVEAARIEVLVHPQSVVHSLVAFTDGSLLAQLGPADMRVPIAHTLGWPERLATAHARLDLAAIARLEFEPPDERRFPALRLARDALDAGGTAPAVLNAANEIAVAAFLEGRIGFLDVAAVVEATLDAVSAPPATDLAGVEAVDAAARRHARHRIERARAS